MPPLSLRNVKKQQQQQKQKKVSSKHIFLQCIFGSLEEFSPMKIKYAIYGPSVRGYVLYTPLDVPSLDIIFNRFSQG